MGLLFISIFLLLAKTAQTIGVSVATIANKMSLVIPSSIAVIFYHEHLVVLQYIGLFLALIAVVLSSLPPGKSDIPLRHHLFLPAIVFIGSGAIDALVNHAKKLPIADDQLPVFISSCFFVAFICGTLFISFRVTTGKDKLEWKSIPAGIILGIPNYFSIYGITRALGCNLMKSSALYPVNNMGIVALSAISALIIFREKFSLVNWIGILLSLGSIALIAFGG
jgi:drug/metabolite transporter (DMT)-like permease